MLSKQGTSRGKTEKAFMPSYSINETKLISSSGGWCFSKVRKHRCHLSMAKCYSELVQVQDLYLSPRGD